VGDREIGIDAEAVRALYGDKVPEVGDNILGWVPDLAERLAAAEGIGGDIRVPLADYLARVDPDVAKGLHDHLRLRDNGLTIEETRGLQSKEVIADPLQLVRGSGGLEPQFSLGDRKVTLQRQVSHDEATQRSKDIFGLHDFDLLDETGKKIGTLNLSTQKDGKQVYVEMIQAGGTPKMYDPNFLGPAIVRDIRRQIKAEFPQAETITGHRVTGAREKAGVEMTAAMPVIKLSQEAPEGWGMWTLVQPCGNSSRRLVAKLSTNNTPHSTTALSLSHTRSSLMQPSAKSLPESLQSKHRSLPRIRSRLCRKAWDGPARLPPTVSGTGPLDRRCAGQPQCYGRGPA